MNSNRNDRNDRYSIKHQEPRICLYCNSPFNGRIDKKFCNDFCRNNFNNEKYKLSETAKEVLHILRRNRRILQTIIGEKMEVKINKDVLSAMDFKYSYHTHVSIDKKNKPVCCCFEYAILSTNRKSILVYKIKNLPRAREVLPIEKGGAHVTEYQL